MSYEQELDYELAMLRIVGGRSCGPDSALVSAYARAVRTLLASMSDEHIEAVRFQQKRGGRVGELLATFRERATRHARGDERPLVLPPEVARVYLEPVIAENALFYCTRECLKCGYDVRDDVRRLHFTCCPLCGGDYEQIDPGHGTRISRNYRGWSKASLPAERGAGNEL